LFFGKKEKKNSFFLKKRKEKQFLEIWRLTFFSLGFFLLPSGESSPPKNKMLVRSIENSQTIVL
jgi:hypothetical protein